MKKNIAILIDEEIEHPKDYKFYSLEEISDLKNDHENIYIGDLIDYIPPSEIEGTIQEIVSKLSDTGQLHIKGPDILQLSWFCGRLNIDLKKFRYIIYGTGRKGCYSLDEVMEMTVSGTGLAVASTSYTNGYEYSLTLKKI
jgi:hypothetical protein